MNERHIINGVPELQNDTMLPEYAMYEDSSGVSEHRLSALHLADGRLFIRGDITPDTAVRFSSSLLYLAKEKISARIYINSGGGEINSGLMMYDAIQDYPGDFEIYCIGRAASMAAVLLAGGRKGKRFVLPHSQVMIHEPLIAGGYGGSASTIEKTAKSILEVRDTLNGIIAQHTGHTLKEVNKATETDCWMTAKEAVEFGICDEIRSMY